MEQRATAGTTELGRARGSIWSSCRQHARRSIQPAGPQDPAPPDCRQEAQDVRPTEGETPTSQRLRFSAGNVLAPNVLKMEPWSTLCAASPGLWRENPNPLRLKIEIKSSDPAATKAQELSARTQPLHLRMGQDLGLLQVWGARAESGSRAPAELGGTIIVTIYQNLALIKEAVRRGR